MSSFVPVDTTIDMRIYMVKHDPFVASARDRIQQLVVKKEKEQNLIATAENQIKRYDDQIADIEAQIAAYEDTGVRGPDLAVDDEKHIKTETSKLIKKADNEADRQLQVELAKVQVPDGWGVDARINTRGHAVVTLTSADQIRPSDGTLERAVRRQFEELREHQAQVYHPKGLGQPPQPVPAPDSVSRSDLYPPWMTPPTTADPPD